MNVEVLSVPTEKPRRDSYDLVVVVDTLRASTVIVKALHNGAMAVYPVGTISEAEEVKSVLPLAILAGERKSFKIKGFDLGNSPLEFTEENVKGKNVVLTTSNGTKAVKKFQGYGTTVSMAFSNVKSVASYSKEFQNILVVCSGSHGELALEDLYTAGVFVNQLEMPALNDGGLIARTLSSEDPIKVFKTAHHGRYLSEKGMAEDLVESCIERDVVPILKRDPMGLEFFTSFHLFRG